ncbi:6,7-dimethyl-8-ribityllumazine synthase [soil metagenome]
MSTKAPTYLASEIPADVKIAIIAARFNAEIVEELLLGCERRLTELKILADCVHVFRVPGAFELPVAAKWAASKTYAAVICLGAVVRGDTPHFEYVAGEAARGISNVALETGVPVIFGVLTTNTHQQALDRIGGSHGHAGERAAEAAIDMIALKRKIY